MIPSVVASQIRRGIEEFLLTTFPITTPYFENCLRQLLESDRAVFRGPFLSLMLPFQPAAGARTFFPEVTPEGFRPHLHQERAFERLGADPPLSTLIATGTGSGKTEAFLYPILAQCLRTQAERGIKAVVIYPMNALANDQARRVAAAIHGSEALRGRVTAGLYIGGLGAREQVVMTADQVITSRDVMREAPPDILLTNYKMLDYLLIRPEDAPLWRFNQPDTLRFVVVDELHTFDGAQGTDLACLLRRLKGRLRTPRGVVCCIGTSATLGTAGDDRPAEDLRQYASEIFGEPFPDGCIVGESRMTPETFLRGELVTRFGFPEPGDHDALDPLRYDTRDAYVAAQARLWLGEDLSVPLDSAARHRLCEHLREHWFLRNLLLIAGDAPRDVGEVLRELGRQLPGVIDPNPDYVAALLQSFLALLSEARAERAGGERAPVDVKLNVWIRELTRLVCRVARAGTDDGPQLRFHDDLSADERQRHLPLVHCRECGMTGWGAVLAPTGDRLVPTVNEFYRGYFAYSPSVRLLYPGEELVSGDEPSLLRSFLCASCLRLWEGARIDACPDCRAPAERVIPVAVPPSTRQQRDGDVAGHHDCRWCGGRSTLAIIGSRSASLTSVAISQLFASPYNEDKKLLAFSDSVQDASHRAGFFGARTFTFGLRAAIQQVVDRQPGRVRLSDLPSLFLQHWRGLLSEEHFIAMFLPPDLEWWADYEEMVRAGRLPEGSDLPERLARRLDWEIWSEYTFECRVGRTLEKTSSSTLRLIDGLLETAVASLLTRLREKIGSLRALDATTLRRFIAGLITQLKNRGGVFHQGLEAYLDRRGTYFDLRLSSYLPPFGRSSRLPVFLSTRPARAFDALVARGDSSTTWYEDWLARGLGVSITAADAHDIYAEVVDGLVSTGVFFERHASAGARVWGLRPDVFDVTNEVAQLRCRRCSFNVSVAREDVTLWEGAICLRYRCPGRLATAPESEDYYRRLYRSGNVMHARVFSREHTALIEQERREETERRFANPGTPAAPNLLSCSPTLEMGVDIGDLSAVVLCSMPPKPSNFIQRSGRAGRRDGNAVLLTMAEGQPHDLFFFEEPRAMLQGQVDPPGCFLNAAAVLQRQFLAFVFDRWVESGILPDAVPRRLGPVLEVWERGGANHRMFPNNLLRFVGEHRDTLEQGFLAIFEADGLTADTRAAVVEYVRGTGPDASLEQRLVDALAEASSERRSLQRAIRRLNDRLRRAPDDPTVSREEEENLQREKQALNDVVKYLNDRPTLELLVDEGLLPNYAFPEAGIQLKSILYRRVERPRPGGPLYETRTYVYQRPAESAIAELAPASSFYVEGRKLKIDQVNVDLSKEESWRFCRRCSHMELEREGERQATCPACADPLWEDDGQVRPLLRMRQVICNLDESRSRSRDESDGRQIEFFERNKFVVKRQADMTAAYALDTEDFPFGFDFFRRLTLREVNFGQRAPDADRLEAAGKVINASGFLVCGACGKVKLEEREEHALHCRYHGRDAAAAEAERALRVFFLYREFASEGIRILLPISVFEADLQLESFVAALDLGLRRYFRGDPGHLRATLYDEPVEASELRRRYLVLYDAVPGGTGYLGELMKDERALLDVLDLARDVLARCPCQNDPTKDGCYRCVLAYRGRHDRTRTSRRRALALLDRLHDRRDRIRRVPRIDTLPVNGLIESELEQQFIEALRVSRPGGAPVQIAPQIVHGRPGWYLQIGERSYLIEPQVEIGAEYGVTVPSRADFVIYPARESSGELPIALFTDGFEFHAAPGPTQRLGVDTAQRMALVKSRRFRVWSLTWEDVHSALSPEAIAFDPIGAPWPTVRQFLELLDPGNLAAWASLPRWNSLDLLLELLGQGAGRDWSHAARSWIAAFLFENRCVMTQDDFRGQREEFLGSDSLNAWPPPGAASEPFAGSVLASLVCADSRSTRGAVTGLVFTTTDALSRNDLRSLSAVFRLFEETAEHDRSVFRHAWRRFLWLSNLLQFAGRVEMVTSTGLRDRAYDRLLTADPFAPEPAIPPPASGEWERARRYASVELVPVLAVLEAAGAAVPQVGFEWVGADGRIAATAELAWEAERVAVLTAAERNFVSVFESAGWTVFGGDGVDAHILVQTLNNRSG